MTSHCQKRPWPGRLAHCASAPPSGPISSNSPGGATRRPSAPAPGEDVPAELLAVLGASAAPAYLLDRLWRACGWNDAAAQLLAPWLDSAEPCLLRFVFLEPAARAFIEDWEDRARRLLAEFRADTADTPEDPAIGSWWKVSSTTVPTLFASGTLMRFWRVKGTRLFNHPHDGRLGYEQVTLVPATHPRHKLVVLLPQDAGGTRGRDGFR